MARRPTEPLVRHALAEMRGMARAEVELDMATAECRWADAELAGDEADRHYGELWRISEWLGVPFGDMEAALASVLATAGREQAA